MVNRAVKNYIRVSDLTKVCVNIQNFFIFHLGKVKKYFEDRIGKVEKRTAYRNEPVFIENIYECIDELCESGMCGTYPVIDDAGNYLGNLTLTRSRADIINVTYIGHCINDSYHIFPPALEDGDYFSSMQKYLINGMYYSGKKESIKIDEGMILYPGYNPAGWEPLSECGEVLPEIKYEIRWIYDYLNEEIDALWQTFGNDESDFQEHLEEYHIMAAKVTSLEEKVNNLITRIDELESTRMKDWKGTAEQYKAIASKDPDTLYFIKGE